MRSVGFGEEGKHYNTSFFKKLRKLRPWMRETVFRDLPDLNSRHVGHQRRRVANGPHAVTSYSLFSTAARCVFQVRMRQPEFPTGFAILRSRLRLVA